MKTYICKDEISLLKRMTTSMMGQIVNIWYELHIYVKHDSWNEFGAGNFVTVPILIVPRPSNQESDDVFDHKNWNPNAYNR